jgi:DNA repair protein RecO (recombination protein O)
MLQRTEGIVLKNSPFGEADLIVTYLTRDCGIINTFAKSPRKVKSRFGSSLEPLTWSRISFWGKEDAALPRLTQADILHPFDSLRSTLHCFLKVTELVDLTLNFIAERDASGKAYSLFIHTLRAMESGSDSPLLSLYYKVKLLEAAGYLPRLSGCGRCGKKGESFYLSHGAVLCETCSRGNGSSFGLSPGVLRFYQNLLDWDFAKIDRIKPSETLLAGLSRIIDEHVRYITDREPRTKAFHKKTAGSE